jgi:hypothetical protein
MLFCLEVCSLEREEEFLACGVMGFSSEKGA